MTTPQPPSKPPFGGSAFSAGRPTGRSRLSDVAALAGVSVKTASRVFNAHPSVSPQTAQRVRDAARELRFSPNGLARELRRGAVTAAVGLVVGDLANPFYCQIAAGVERVLRGQGLELFLATSDEDPEHEQAVVRTLLERRVRALLVIPAAQDHSYLEPEQALGTPMVFLDRPPIGLDTDTVLIDNRVGARRAVRQLLALGHLRIAVLADSLQVWTARERLAGAREALHEAGIDRPDLEIAGVADPDAARLQTRRLLARDAPPTAFVSLNNRVSLGVLAGLREHAGPSRRIDAMRCALIGFDDFDAARLLDVSVISHDPGELGRVAAGLALERLAGQPDQAVRTVVLPTTVIPRGSGERPPAPGPVPVDPRSTSS